MSPMPSTADFAVKPLMNDSFKTNHNFKFVEVRDELIIQYLQNNKYLCKKIKGYGYPKFFPDTKT